MNFKLLYLIFISIYFKCNGQLAVTTIAGASAGTTNGIGTNAAFNGPTGIVLSYDGSYYLILDLNNNQIRSLTYVSQAVSFICGGTSGRTNGVGTNAQFTNPQGIAISSTGTFAIIADTANHQIRQLTISTFSVSYIAGSSSAGTGTTNGVGTNALFYSPSGVAISSDNSYVIVTDFNNHQIRKVVIATQDVSLLAGATSVTSGNANGVGTNARFNAPYGIDISSDGTYVLITDSGYGLIRKIVISTLAVTLVAGGGGGTSTGVTNGFGTNAQFYTPYGIALTSDDSFAFIVEYGNHQVRQLTVSTTEVIIISGNPSGSSGNANGVGTNAYFSSPRSVVVSSDDSYILVSDTGNNRIRQVTRASPTSSPTSAPTRSPTYSPSSPPTYSPSVSPSFSPTVRPSRPPTSKPSSSPSFSPTLFPSNPPTYSPTTKPTKGPTTSPTKSPTFQPTSKPSKNPTSEPTTKPSSGPTTKPSSPPSFPPTFRPSTDPSFSPSSRPSFKPTTKPTRIPSPPPTFRPSVNPTSKPSKNPTFEPTTKPTRGPTTSPTKRPSVSPSFSPTKYPTYSPTTKPTRGPTTSPTTKPTRSPTFKPTLKPIIN